MTEQHHAAAPDPCTIRLVIADVDGTLVTPQKELTPRSIEAVHKLHAAGIAFAITSGRPPRGMSMLVEPLRLKGLIAAFNGGMFVKPDLSIVEQHVLPAGIADAVAKSIEAHKLDAWVYRGADWFVRQRHGCHVDREEATVRFAPTVVPNYDGVYDQAVKIVGVSDDYDLVARCEADLRSEFGDHVSAARSQPYYLDVTHPRANKGTVARQLSKWLQVPAEQIATIGDMPNDVLMFALCGLSIAMGNATREVQRAARRVTTSNEEEGFATAMERYVLCGRPELAAAGEGASASGKE
jgi:Cof subfamily protein (haloacid dehalogenase superfamily)